MENIREHIYLAALLHDIGKFYQRADIGFSDKYKSLSDYSRKIAKMTCPVDDHTRFSYQHAVWANDFFEKKRKTFEELCLLNKNTSEYDSKNDSFVNFACNHHHPQTEQQAIITLADWWSTGTDRRTTKESEKELKDDKIKWGDNRHKQVPLYSIFNRINDGNCQSAFGLHSLNLDEGQFFPKKINKSSDGVNQNQYKKLWNEFLSEFDKLPSGSIEVFTESLLFLLKKYTWCIPSNTEDLNDVSLYDHLKTTAAFADCLFLYKESNPNEFYWNSENKTLALKEDVKPVILVGGDISGIQKFIYDIASRKAAVSLKGRSFYLQLLIDSIIQRIITHKDINCSLGQIIYSSGGKFYMLLPNTDKVKKAILQLREEFEKKLWNDHNGQLILNLDYVAFSFSKKERLVCFENEEDAKIGDLWKYLAEKLTENKSCKFKSVLTDYYEQLFKPQEVDEKSAVCAVTGIESSKCETINNKNDKDDNIFVLPIVNKQIELGGALKDADCIISSKSDNISMVAGNDLGTGIDIVNIHTCLTEKIMPENNSEWNVETYTGIRRHKMINNLKFLDSETKEKAYSYGFQFYGGNKQAKNGNRNKTFDELADETYLGILRMDVDNLGAIFIKGLPETDKNFAAYSTLSFMLDYFFSGYLNTIRNKDCYKDDVNILYSGGDDVFAVGKWDKLILFAEAIRRDFARFVGRDDISISGGIVFVGEKYPISKAAALAGDAEDHAKQYNRNKFPKNAFNLFGENISWNYKVSAVEDGFIKIEEFDKKDCIGEFGFVKWYMERFVSLCNEEKMPRSILHRLMILCNHMREGDLSYIWHTAYFLKRFSEQKSDKIKNECKILQVILCNKRNYELVAIAARWAELKMKF
jgi:CRISPR-associated protein Csm1